MTPNKIYPIGVTATLLLTLMLAGCGEIETPTELETTSAPTAPQDTTPPATPRNLKVLVGDNLVTLTWDANTEKDLAGYYVKRKDEVNPTYTVIGTVSKYSGKEPRVQSVDKNVENGRTYWYAVTSYDQAQPPNESPISEAVMATPRPEGRVTLTIGEGFDFSAHKKTPGDSPHADIIYDWAKIQINGIFMGVEGRRHDVMFLKKENLLIQDMGYTKDFSQVNLAPYFPKVDMENEEDVNHPAFSYTGLVTELDVGHTYALWFNEPGEEKDLYAKFRVAELGGFNGLPPTITVEWAIQEKPNTPQLAPPLMNWRAK